MLKSLFTKGLLALAVFVTVSNASAENKVYIETTPIIPGSSATLSFMMDNDVDIRGYQMDITLPAGLEFQKNTAGTKVKLDASDRDEDFNISSQTQSSGALRVLGVSLDGEIVIGNSGAIFYAYVDVASDFQSGEITMTGITLTDNSLPQPQSINIPDYSLDLEAEINVTNITISPSGNQEMTEGETMQFTATVAPANATNQNVEWSISDNNVASISSNGNTVTVSALSAGTATLTATAADGSNVTATVQISVVAAVVPVTSITISPSGNQEMTEGETMQFTATVAPANATNQNVEWSISDNKVASISSNGNTVTVSALSVGTATLTATAADGSNVTATVQISVVAAEVPVTAITISPSGNQEMSEGETMQFTATVAPANAINQNVEWSISDNKVASISVNGNKVTLTAIAEGTATLIATSAYDNKVTAQVLINVISEKEIPATSVTIDYDGSTTLVTGMTLQLSASVLPENASSKEVEWTSSNPEVATVNDNGLLTTIGVGNVTITVSLISNPQLSSSIQFEVKEDNSNGIAGIIADGDGNYLVYNIAGHLVVKASSISNILDLPKGIYVINGKKVNLK